MRRVLAWFACIGLCIPVSFVMAWAHGIEDAPVAVKVGIGILIGVPLALLIELVRRRQVEAFTTIVERGRAGCAALLARRRGDGVSAAFDPLGLAALEIEAGDVAMGLGRLRTIALGMRIGPTGSLAHCVLLHADVVSSAPPARAGALAPLLETPRPRTNEAARYRAYLVARAAMERFDDALVGRALAALEGDSDERVRTIAHWIRAWHDLPLEPREKPDEARRAAALAMAHQAEALAERVESRAVRIEHALGASAYR